jgi:hypothetical protein
MTGLGQIRPRRSRGQHGRRARNNFGVGDADAAARRRLTLAVLGIEVGEARALYARNLVLGVRTSISLGAATLSRPSAST